MKSGASELLFFYTECTKTHLQAFTGQTNFPEAPPPDPPGYGEGEGKGGEEGREGKKEKKRARGWKGEGEREGEREKGPGREGRERTGATAPQVSNPVHAPAPVCLQRASRRKTLMKYVEHASYLQSAVIEKRV
jgi:hypothetical protein